MPGPRSSPSLRTSRPLSPSVSAGYQRYRDTWRGYARAYGSLGIHELRRQFGHFATMAPADMRRRYYAKVRLSRQDLKGAFAYATNTQGVEFYSRIDERGRVEAFLYEMRSKQNTRYEDVEDGFTQRRDNYDESTVTLQQLAEQVKTLKRDLKRAGTLG